MSGYKELRVWQAAMDLVVATYKISRMLPTLEVYELGSQIRRSAVSIPANIAEGTCRTSKKETAHFLSIAQGSAAELETLLDVVQRVGYADTQNQQILTGQVRKMLAGLATTYK